MFTVGCFQNLNSETAERGIKGRERWPCLIWPLSCAEHSYLGLEVLELGAELEELGGGEQDGAERLDHVRREPHVRLVEQDLGAAAVDVLRVQQQTQLPVMSTRLFTDMQKVEQVVK